jgi:hypothetical protein
MRLPFLLLLAAVACDSQPAAGVASMPPMPNPHASGVPGVPAVPQGAGRGPNALTWSVPAGWSTEMPANTMRRAQYAVNGAGGKAECVVFYFGPGQGGDASSNVNRWASQFTLADGTPAAAAMKTSTLKVGDIDVTLVEVTGTYSAGMMGGAAAAPMPNHMLLGAVATGADANWFFKLTGPESTVQEQRAAFDGMLRSLARGR